MRESDGSSWVINGSKMFTSNAHNARYVFLLTNTDLTGPRHRNLTMFLVPLATAGVEIHGIRTVDGDRTNIFYYSDVGSTTAIASASSTAAGRYCAGRSTPNTAPSTAAPPDRRRHRGAVDNGAVGYLFRLAGSTGIYGGTLEVFRNMIAQHALRLGKPNYS